MNQNLDTWNVLRPLSRWDVLTVCAVLLLAGCIAFTFRRIVRRLAEKAPSRLRLSILRIIPITRFVIGIIAVVIIVPIVVEPTFQDIIALLVSIGLALAFALKDYVSSLLAGLATVLENTYQPGDWIEVDGTYGEVKSIGARAVRIVTPDDTEVMIPHLRLWTTSIFNATSGNRSLLCVADFYLHPDHDALAASNRLKEIAQSSTFRKPNSPVTVIVLEKPWGTHYRLKAYVYESREQFLFLTDLTIRGKEAIRALGIRFAQIPYAATK